MKFVKLKDVIQTLEKLESEYVRLKGLAADQVRDDQIDQATETFSELRKCQASI